LVLLVFFVFGVGVPCVVRACMSCVCGVCVWGGCVCGVWGVCVCVCGVWVCVCGCVYVCVWVCVWGWVGVSVYVVCKCGVCCVCVGVRACVCVYAYTLCNTTLSGSQVTGMMSLFEFRSSEFRFLPQMRNGNGMARAGDCIF